MRTTDRGAITFKALMYLAFIGIIIFIAFKTIPVYVNNYQLQDYLTTQTPFWVTQRVNADAVRANVLAKAQDLDLPLEADDVTVEANPNKVSVNIDFHVPIDLKVFTWQLHFTDSSENRSII